MTKLVTETAEGYVRLIGINRPDKRNAMNMALLEELSEAFARAEADSSARAIVLFAHGPVFTAGLDLIDVFPRLGEAESLFSKAGIDPWATHGPARTKPLVVAVHGKCLTLGIELVLAADVTVAAEGTTFAQIEIDRGIFPFGGGVARWVQRVGWGNAMQYLLTGDELDMREAHRLGVVQRVVPTDELMPTALEIAGKIAAKPPLAVQATIQNGRTFVCEGEGAAAAELMPAIKGLAGTADLQEALAAYLERRTPHFQGR